MRLQNALVASLVALATAACAAPGDGGSPEERASAQDLVAAVRT